MQRLLTIVETPSFSRDAERHLSGAERNDLLVFLASNPEAGAVIPGTGGFRKLRVGLERQSKGKSGGARAIYYFYDASLPLFLVALYAKGEKVTLTNEEKRELYGIAKMFPAAYASRRAKNLGE